METIEAIQTRRSIRKVADEMPEKNLIMQILDAARYAPNHFNTEPWRFTVLSGSGRDRLGRVLGRLNQEKMGSTNQDERAAAMEKGLAKARRAPIVIVIAAEPSNLAKAKEIEEIAATACAVQNMLLAAHVLGIGAMWRTGDPTYTAEMQKEFGESEKSLIMGFIYLGHPDSAKEAPVPARKRVEEMTTWVDQ
ncbi:MAG: nitroreductase [Sporolactobacillus sp.]